MKNILALIFFAACAVALLFLLASAAIDIRDSGILTTKVSDLTFLNLLAGNAIVTALVVIFFKDRES